MPDRTTETAPRTGFNSTDLAALATREPVVAVSIFLPTHTSGRETRQDPIRLNNLIGQARAALLDGPADKTEADNILGPAAALVDDHQFWQHQQEGLALFLEPGGARVHQVGVSLPEHVAVGPTFSLRPMLPAVAADGSYFVLTITADQVDLFHGSRFSLARVDASALPNSVADLPGEADYENPVQASPVARPNTGSIDVSNAQVYGDSPTEWRKQRLVDFVRRTAGAVENHLVDGREPVVVIADTEIAGHFQKLTNLGSRLAGVIDTNPEALSDGDIHSAAYEVVRSQLDSGLDEVFGRLSALLAAGDGRAAIEVHDVVRAATQGRVETLLVIEDGVVSEHYDEAADQFRAASPGGGSGDDLLETAVRCTLRHKGDIHLVARDLLPDGALTAALLRY